jgi:hypothetical protein
LLLLLLLPVLLLPVPALLLLPICVAFLVVHRG